VADYLQTYVTAFDLPVRLNAKVTSLTRTDDGFEVRTADDTFLARQVVVATGLFQVPFIPPAAQGLEPSVIQISQCQLPQSRGTGRQAGADRRRRQLRVQPRWSVSVIIGSPDAEQLSLVMAAICGMTPPEQQGVEHVLGAYHHPSRCAGPRHLAVYDTGAPPPHVRQGRRRQPRRTRRRAVLRTTRVAPVARPAAMLSRRCVSR
jgi:hypothetical protein